MNRKLQAIQDAADHLEQRRRRVKKVALRVSAGKGWIKMTSAGGAAQDVCGAATELCRPSSTPARENRACRGPRLRGWKPFLQFTQG